MLSNKGKTSSEPKVGQVVTVIAEDCTVGGPVSASGSVRIDGEVKGDVKITGSLILGKSGKIEGNITADNAFLAGHVSGNVDASKGRVEISNTGKLIGDITAHSLVIDENAVFQGKSTMTNDEAADAKDKGKK